MLPDTALNPPVILTSDASGGWGCGAHAGTKWFALPWSGSVQESHITVKELVPIVIAALIWGHEWKGETILARCDNAVVVAIVNSGSSRNPQAMHLRRCLAFLTARMDFTVRATHIRGINNVAADALSSDNSQLFHSCCLQAEPQGAVVSPEVLDVVLLREPDWMAKDWTRLWTSMWWPPQYGSYVLSIDHCRHLKSLFGPVQLACSS